MLEYSDMKMQDYLLHPTLSIEDKKTIFRWRIRMEQFGENFKAGRDSINCPLCNSHLDSQSEAFTCKAI